MIGMMKVAMAVLDIMLIGLVLRRVLQRFRRRRLFIVNFDGFFTSKPIGKVAHKCMKLAWRCLFLMKKGDAIIVAHPVPDEFLDYVETVLGFRPTVYTIQNVRMPLDIMSEILNEHGLIERLKADTKSGRWVIQPLISTEAVFLLSFLLRIPVAGTPRQFVDDGLVRRLNSKVSFALWCEFESLTTAGVRCYTTDAVRAAAVQIIRRGEAAVIREDISAGGLGNGCYNSIEQVVAMLSRFSNTLSLNAMVGPLLELPHHVSVIFEVKWWGVRIFSSCFRRLASRTESVGGVTPCQELPGLKKAVSIARRYGQHLRRLGYRGIADIDFAFSADGNEIVLFESNARLVLTSAPLNIAEHFAELWGLRLRPVIVDYHEDPPKGHRMNLEQTRAACAHAVAHVAQHGAKNPKRLELIVVSPPDPDSGWYSIAAAAEHREDAAALWQAFCSLIEDMQTSER